MLFRIKIFVNIARTMTKLLSRTKEIILI